MNTLFILPETAVVFVANLSANPSVCMMKTVTGYLSQNKHKRKRYEI